MRVHAIRTGRLAGNETFLRGHGWSALFRRPRRFEFPAFVYIVEHPDGHIAIDTGPSSRGWPTPGPVGRIVPSAMVEPADEIAPQIRASGLDPDGVRTVVLTHLDPDHVGGIAHFPHAEHLVHRPGYELATSRQGRLRSRPQDWPPWFEPTLYDLEQQPYGPFPASRALTGTGDLRLVCLAGHTIGQVGVIAPQRATTLFFVADHMFSQEWFTQNHAAGRLTHMGIAAPKHYAETDRPTRSRVPRTSPSGPPARPRPKAHDRLSEKQSGRTATPSRDEPPPPAAA